MDLVTGVVLAGGRSSRMGTDKAQLRLADLTLLDRSLTVLRECFAETLVVGRELPDELPGCGPLGGIVTALRRRPAIFVVACDMPFLNAALIRAMAGQLAGYEAVAVPGEPLHAGYAQSALPAAEQQIATGDYSVHRWLSRLRVRHFTELARQPEWRRSFCNVNTPADFAAAQAQV